MNYRQFQPGQRVRTVFGELGTVAWQRGCVVAVVVEGRGSVPINHHPSKIQPVRG